MRLLSRTACLAADLSVNCWTHAKHLVEAAIFVVYGRVSHWVHVAEGDGREVHRLDRVLHRAGVDGVVEVLDAGRAYLPQD